MNKFVFTSCVRIEAFPSQPQWSELSKLSPDYLFLLGDNIYLDYWPYKKCRNPELMSDQDFEFHAKSLYEKQWNEPHFSKLVREVRSKGGIYGTWDDHDFAWNNAIGSRVTTSKSLISRKLFNQYFYENKSNQKLYKVVDTELTRVIILDQKSYSEKLTRNADLIGPEQIKFLKEALNHDKPYTFICGSIPLTKSSSILGIRFKRFTDYWAKYEREYLEFKTLIDSKANIFYFGGDIHRNDFDIPNNDYRPCYEIISSGMAIDKFASKSVKFFPVPGYDLKSNWFLVDVNSDGINFSSSTKTWFFKRRNKTYFVPKV